MHYKVTLNEWGLAGFFSANALVTASEYVWHYHLLQGRVTGLWVLVIAVVVDVLVCVALQSQDRTRYTAAPSLIPYDVTPEERKRRTENTVDMLAPFRNLIGGLEFHEGMEPIAREVVLRIPAQCPFERDVKLFGRTLFHIPPLCKLNPLYDELDCLRYRALLFLEAQGEDIGEFI